MRLGKEERRPPARESQGSWGAHRAGGIVVDDVSAAADNGSGTAPPDEDALEAAEESGRRATNLELFLDLVFVFAVTEVAAVLASDMSVAGFGRGLLLAWLVWWLWSQFTWLGTAIDLSGRSPAQFLVLATVPFTLLLAVALPGAYASSGLEFAGAYLAVNLWALAIQGWGLWSQPATRSAWLHFAPLATLAPLVLLVGAFLRGGARVAVWCAVAAFNVASALAGARGQEGKTAWTVDPDTSANDTRSSSSSRWERSWSPSASLPLGCTSPRRSAPAFSLPSPSPACSGGPTSASCPRRASGHCAQPRGMTGGASPATASPSATSRSSSAWSSSRWSPSTWSRTPPTLRPGVTSWS